MYYKNSDVNEINNYDQFTYTKVNVPLTLKICPSDHDGSDYFVDVNCDMYAQECCYIGEQYIEKIQIQRTRSSQVQLETVEPQWLICRRDVVAATGSALCHGLISLPYKK